jgi:putative multiple sugar transport system permease protein
MSNVKSFVSKNAMLVVLLLTILFFQILLGANGQGSLVGPQNLTNLIAPNSYVALLAPGLLLGLLTGGNIDLSVGSIVILVGAISGFFIVNWHWNVYLSIALCLVISTLIGAWQAFWIAYVRIPPFVTTLAGMLMFRGLALIILGSQGIGPYPDNYKAPFNSFIPSSWVSGNPGMNLTVSIIIAAAVCAIMIAVQLMSRVQKQKKGYAVDKLAWSLLRMAVVSAVLLFVFWRMGYHNGVPVILILISVIVLVYSYYTQNTVPGRYLYAMGGNEKAARLSGVNTKKMLFFAYTNMGFLAGVAALVCVARFNQASTQAGTGYEMDAIGACYIGGASAYGGVGTVGGAVIGAIFMGVLNMGMSLMGWDPNLQRVIKGGVLLAAVIFDVLSKKRKQAA